MFCEQSCISVLGVYVLLFFASLELFPQCGIFVTGFVTRLTRRVSLVEHELPTLPEHLSSSPFLVGFVLLDL